MNETSFDKLPPLLTHLQVSDRVSYCRAGIDKLEANGQFPARYRLSQRRIAWNADDVLAWMQAWVDARRTSSSEPLALRLTHDDRFLSRKRLTRILKLSRQRIQQLEAAGNFPSRFPIGQKRVAWLEREIIAWLQARRDSPTLNASGVEASSNG